MQKYSTLALIVIALIATAGFVTSALNLSQQVAVVPSVASVVNTQKTTQRVAVSSVAGQGVNTFTEFTPKDLPSLNSCFKDYNDCKTRAWAKYYECMRRLNIPLGDDIVYPYCQGYAEIAVRTVTNQCEPDLFSCISDKIGPLP